MSTTPDSRGANRVPTLSTIGFTAMFAVWLMFGILGKPISQEFGLSEVQLAGALTAICLAWMHWTVVHMLHGQSPELAIHLENPDETLDLTTPQPQEARA